MAQLNSTMTAVAERRRVFAEFEKGQFAAAANLGEKLLKSQRDDTKLMHLVGMSFMRIGAASKAAGYLEKCLQSQPDNVALLCDLGSVESTRGDLDKALEWYDRALRVNADSSTAIAGKAVVYERRFDYDRAWELLKPLIDAGRQNGAVAVIHCRILQARDQHHEAIALADQFLADKNLDSIARHFLCESLAKSLEKVGDYDRAFAAYEQSNRLKAARFDREAYVAKVDQLIATYSEKNLARLPRSRCMSEIPIFVASMPRSGSTLVEQIIHAHPKAFGAGEITHIQELVNELPSKLDSFQPYPACLGDFKQSHADAFATEYLEAIKGLGGKALRIANKHLENYRHLGLIALLFPKARIVHVKRDPLDNCFSCFMAQLAPAAMPWATELVNIGAAYRQYERLMDHWKRVLTIPILDVQYEELVDNTDAGIRRIIDFCGLPWDDKCLRYWEAERDVLTLSYDQVRKPIYKSAVKRYERYEKFLGPLREVLAEPMPQ